MSQLQQLFVLKQVLQFIFVYCYSCCCIWEVNAEVKVTEKESAVVLHRPRQLLCFAKSRVYYSLNHFCSPLNLTSARRQMTVQKGKGCVFDTET